MKSKQEHERKRRERRFVPKNARRKRRFYQDEAMMEAGVVISRPHGRARVMGEL